MRIARIKLGNKEKIEKEIEEIMSWIGELPDYRKEVEEEFVKPREDVSKNSNPKEIVNRFPKRRNRYCLV